MRKTYKTTAKLSANASGEMETKKRRRPSGSAEKGTVTMNKKQNADAQRDTMKMKTGKESTRNGRQ